MQSLQVLIRRSSPDLDWNLAGMQACSSCLHADKDTVWQRCYGAHDSRMRVYRVREFIHSLDPGALVADVGCGNGAHWS